MIVYLATNTVNGKVYVGKTVRTLSHAKARHHQRAKFIWKYGVYSRFYTALRKYGFEAFEWRVIYEGLSDSDIQAHERLFIAQFNSTDKKHGYNMTPGGDGGAGKTLSETHIQKLRAYFAGENNPQHGKTGPDHPAFGHRHNEQTKQRISAAHKGKVVLAETRKKLSETRKAMFADQVSQRRIQLEADRIKRRAEMQRRVAAGEFKGENAGASKLTNEQRKAICQRRQAGESYASIAKDFTVGLTGVRSVCQSWGPENGYSFAKIVAPRKQRLSDSDKRSICEQYKLGERLAKLAKAYSIGETSIHTVLRTWGPKNGFPELAPRPRSKSAK